MEVRGPIPEEDGVIETVTALGMGLGLAAACGLRVFLPLLLMSIGVRAGMIDPSSSWTWIGTWPAIIAFATACVLEVAGYYIPIVDHVLDGVAVPAATIAGAVAAGAAIVGATGLHDVHPILDWGMALIAGGGLATSVKLGSAVTRAVSTTTTATAANPIVASVENVGSAILSVLAILAPIVAGVVVLAAGFLVVRFVGRRVAMRRRAGVAA